MKGQVRPAGPLRDRPPRVRVPERRAIGRGQGAAGRWARTPGLPCPIRGRARPRPGGADLGSWSSFLPGAAMTPRNTLHAHRLVVAAGALVLQAACGAREGL